MRTRVDPNDFREYLDRATFQDNGDKYERRFAAYLAASLPNAQAFWRRFVVPLTVRVENYPAQLGSQIGFRSSVADELQDIASAHYSMTVHIGLAHEALEGRQEFSLELTYVHLAAACDLAEAVLEKWYLLLLSCQGMQSAVLASLSREEFLALAGKWYDEAYPDFFKHYLSRGKSPSLRLPARDDLITEYLGDCPPRKLFAKNANLVRTVRNVILHDVNVARVVLEDNVTLVPRAEVISRYRQWRSVAAAAKNRDTLAREFVEQHEQATAHLESILAAIAEMWLRLLDELDHEFYAADRRALRDRFDIGFAPRGPVVAFGPYEPTGDPSGGAPPSGTYTGGSVDIHTRR